MHLTVVFGTNIKRFSLG